ncbi:alpha/beta fold hydrolase [Nonomuraea fuscirosea]|uniref:alpha/beta fold hydrolase n=1 Tax=Nonomuraea fuscirosea TaxID=1291556 RepID=UPI003439895E
MAATEDRFVAPEHSAELAEHITGARLVQVPGGHAAIVEDPQQTLEALAGFFKELTC